MKYILLSLIGLIISGIDKFLGRARSLIMIPFNRYLIRRLIRNVALQNRDINVIQDQKYYTDIVYSLVFTHRAYLSLPSNLYTYIDRLVEVGYFLDEIEITSLYGSTNGKSAPDQDLDSFSRSRLEVITSENRKYYTNPISFSTPEDFKRNIEALEKRFEPQEIVFHEFRWNKRIFLSTSDKAHTIAAIYRQAKEQRLKYKIKGNRYIYVINQEALRTLNNNWLCYVIGDQHANYHASLELFNKLKEKIESYIYFPINGPCIYLFFRKGSFYSNLIVKEFEVLEEQGKVINFYKLC